MLYLQDLNVNATVSYPLATGVTVEEGDPLVFKIENGRTVVQKCTDTANERFAGFAYKNYGADPTTKNTAQLVTVPASVSYTVTLAKGLIVSAASIRVIQVVSGVLTTTALTIITSGSPNSGEVLVNLTTGLLTFNSAQAGLIYQVSYRRTLVGAEVLMAAEGSKTFHRAGNEMYDLVTVLQGPGVAWTDRFVVAAAYEAANPAPVTLGASGLLTLGGTGTVIGYVEAPPTVEQPLLGVRFIAPQ